VTGLPRDPLAQTDRLLVDGSNLSHALRREGGSIPPSTLIARLRGAVPQSIGVELVFDGVPDRGMRGERVAAGLIVRYGGRRSADELLVDLVDEARAAVGPAGTAGLLVVTDDRALRIALRERGARTAGTAWLIGRLERARLAAPSVGNKRPPGGPVAPRRSGSGPRRRSSGSGRMPS
jgi:hypothetical protein